MANEILNIHNAVNADDVITNIQHHAYSPYTNSFNNNDVIHITIQQQDLYVLPHESYIFIEGQVIVATAATDATEAQRTLPNFVNNAAGFLFDEIRYEINGFPIDCCKNVGITTTLKGYASYSPNNMSRMQIAGWKKESNQQATAGYIFLYTTKKYFWVR